MRFMLLIVVLGAVATACSTPKLVGSESVRIVDSASLPAPATADAAKLARGYVLGPGDRISIQVFGIEEASSVVQVDSTGRVALPLAGPIEVAGKTAEEVGVLAEQRLRSSYVRDPKVTVNLVEGKSQVVTIDGQVEQPGLYPLLGRMTLMRAIATAKGTTEFAKERHVVIFRNVNDQQMAALYDLQAIRRGAYTDPEVYANDVVVVGEDNARRVFQSLVQAGALLTAPLVAVIQQ